MHIASGTPTGHARRSRSSALRVVRVRQVSAAECGGAASTERTWAATAGAGAGVQQ
ncbi:hypothetical protein [Streptomyces sp. NPDC058739]|uniref:hypothetical protein n=1 Tax=Streptomyces sp. NPDC058739 TaxID=3346618 RepID=UPI0036BF7E08